MVGDNMKSRWIVEIETPIACKTTLTSFQVDLINMSYGEHSHWSNTGRVGDLMAEVINKAGVTWVCSAGNDGPALCTVSILVKFIWLSTWYSTKIYTQILRYH